MGDQDSRAWRVRVHEVAEEQIRDLARKHSGQRKHLIALLESLRDSPDLKGKALKGALAGFRRVSRGRFRVVYKVFEGELVVVAVAAGWREDGARDDPYALVSRLISSGRLDLARIEAGGPENPD